MKFFRREIIRGCEARGDAESAYLTRYTLVSGRHGKLCLHIFHRSDADELHDHPWGFWSLILWRGYIEQTPRGRKRVWPGMLLHRRATCSHRVELVNGRKAITLVWMGKSVQAWGFFTSKGWMHFREYFREKGC